MELQILDADYVMVNEKPVVRVFGKTLEGKTVCVFREDFMPYFYAKGEGAEEMLKNEPQVVKIEKVRKRAVFDMGNESDMIKVTLKHPAKTPQIRDMLTEKDIPGSQRKHNITAFEADVLFKYRYMADEGLMGMGWAKTEESVGTSTSTVHAEVMATAKKLTSIERTEDAPLKTVAFDIECVPMVSGNMPESSRDPVIMVSFVFSHEYKGKKSIVLSLKKSDYAQSFGTEKELLEEFIRIINEYDPDIITGYNINNFDLPYILERMGKENVRAMFGRCVQKPVMARKIGIRYKISIVGRVIVDSFELVKKDFSLKRYTLDNVSHQLLGERKIEVKHSEIEKLWKGNKENLNKLVNYCRKDSVLAFNLVEKLSLIDKYIALSKISGTLLQDTLNSGETTRIENYLLRAFNEENFVFPCRPDDSIVAQRTASRRKDLVGGFVLDPKKGLHNNVAVLDFKSMYPSIIRTFNICPTTIVKEDRPGLIKVVTGAKFLPIEERQGIIPKILTNLMNSRDDVKKELDSEKDSEKKRLLNAKQWALKILANAFYGHMGYARAKIYDIDIANAITGSGRDIIQNTTKIIEEKFKKEVVYGDTDSVFVKMDIEDLDELGKVADDISEHITKNLPGVMELEFEKVFKRFLPLTKKRYAAWKYERTKDGWKNKIEMKGIETVRRDWCILVSESLTHVIESIIIKDDIKGALGFFKEIVKDLNAGKVPIEKLVITKGMSKPPEKYVGKQPHIELAKKLKIRNPADAPGVGDRIGYVILKGTGLLSDRTEDPAYVTEKGLPIDSNYYIENQLLPPLERIFGALNISKSELLGNGKQMGLLDILGIQKKGTVSDKVVDIKNVNGFMCSKCNKFYSRVPLVGVCECGAAMHFSTSQGPAQKAKV